jgi:hypothetical protein
LLHSPNRLHLQLKHLLHLNVLDLLDQKSL